MFETIFSLDSGFFYFNVSACVSMYVCDGLVGACTASLSDNCFTAAIILSTFL